MMTATDTLIDRRAPGNRMTALIANIRTSLAKRRACRTTINALSELSDHELRDLGITRGQIGSVARETVHQTRRTA